MQIQSTNRFANKENYTQVAKRVIDLKRSVLGKRDKFNIIIGSKVVWTQQNCVELI